MLRKNSFVIGMKVDIFALSSHIKYLVLSYKIDYVARLKVLSSSRDASEFLTTANRREHGSQAGLIRPYSHHVPGNCPSLPGNIPKDKDHLKCRAFVVCVLARKSAHLRRNRFMSSVLHMQTGISHFESHYHRRFNIDAMVF